MVGRESLCPGSCTSPWSSSSLYQLKRRKAGGCRHGNEDTQHKVKTCQIGWNLQKVCRGTVCTLTRHLSLSVDVCVLGAQSCLTLCNPIDCNPPGSSVHGILQVRILEWVAIPFSRGIFLTQGSNPPLLHCG